MNCEEWLAEYLKGPVFKNCERVRASAEKRGFTKGQLSAARKKLGVATVSDSTKQNGAAKNWYWLIPKEDD